MDVDLRVDPPLILREQGDTALESIQVLRSGIVDIINLSINISK